MKTIDLTPTWETATHIYLMVLDEGAEEGKAMARQELLRLARTYDALIASLKQEKVA